MTRGVRSGYVTCESLRERLQRHASSPAHVAYLKNATLSVLAGHALHYKLLSDLEVAETTPKTESTIPCYLWSVVGHLSERQLRVIDDYVMEASRLFRRGSLILNLMAMDVLGDSIARDAPRERFDASDAALRDVADLLLSQDPRGNAVKQAFFPERWTTEGLPVDARIARVMALHGDVLPPAPASWKDIMQASGWDNALNRMATKYAGNVKAALTLSLRDRAKRFAQTLAPWRQEGAAEVLGDTLVGRLRPLAVHDEDFETLMTWRRILGCCDGDSTYYPPLRTPATAEACMLHLYIARNTPLPPQPAAAPPAQSATDGASERRRPTNSRAALPTMTYLPVASRGRKYCYIDAVVAKAFHTVEVSSSGKRESVKLFHKRPAAPGGDVATASAASTSKGAAATKDQEASDCVDDYLDVTRDRFNDRSRRVRASIRKRLRRLQARPNATPRDKKRVKDLRAKARRVGINKLPAGVRIHSVETDGVGLRLVIKTPRDMAAHVRPLPTVEEIEAAAAAKKARSRKGEGAAAGKAAPQPVASTVPGAAGAALVAIDRGRAKLLTAAISASPEADREATSYVYTRGRYYHDIKYHAHQKIMRRRAAAPRVSAALQALAATGGHKNCDAPTWRQYLAAEREHEVALDDEYVRDKEYALWRMRMFRWKRRSMDAACTRLLERGVQAVRREQTLVVADGDATFAATGRGELSVPTATLSRALARAVQRLRERRLVGHVEALRVWEHRTTLCCCRCGSATQPATVSCRDARTGETSTRPSRRLRSCTVCETTGKLRDRDVQAARNILQVARCELRGQPRPRHLCRGGEFPDPPGLLLAVTSQG